MDLLEEHVVGRCRGMVKNLTGQRLRHATFVELEEHGAVHVGSGAVHQHVGILGDDGRGHASFAHPHHLRVRLERRDDERDARLVQCLHHRVDHLR